MKRKVLERYAVVDKDGHTTDGYYTGMCIGKYRLLIEEDDDLEIGDEQLSEVLKNSKLSKKEAVNILQQMIYFGMEVLKSMEEEEQEEILKDIEDGNITLQ